MERAWEKHTLGWQLQGEKVARRVQQQVIAYRQFLANRGVNTNVEFHQLPVTDKQSYALAYPYEELLGGDREKILAIFRSSGSSGNPFFWPVLKPSSRFLPLATRLFLEQSFAIHQRKTMVIVGLGLGSWLPGEHFSWGVKNVAMQVSYPFWVFTPGTNFQEIIEMVQRLDNLVEQMIILITPAAISHLHLTAQELGKTLPVAKLKYVLLGEPFPESIRSYWQTEAGIPPETTFMLSMYGSADTGGLGVESLGSVAVRQILEQHPALAKELGITPPIPLFFHSIAFDAFLEIVDGSLCITRWQGIPLVRYMVYDKVAFYRWKKLKQAILTSKHLPPGDNPWVDVLAKSANWLPNIIAVTGRSDSCLILDGTNITEYMLDEAIRCPELQTLLTGIYRAKIIYAETRQHLALELETQVGVTINSPMSELIYHQLVQFLGRTQPVFLAKWKNDYSHWDADPDKRVLKLHFSPWPSLSQTTEYSIKQRGILRE
ncbi:MAG TPA: hypothetical protein IGS52_20735 [Oscillatoriaceae cyanobacterium M33_DOE_052]|uniref:GH3 auxin-responsive promoter n=1 Tax=Planktothricoides sp. SpSt-374 TaxID=2282167 RepID=A0A7C3VJT4_9CYAN|nr:hypothetical protein [Oscillatoriaceae cyanobacterium M33_DOE_052]